MVQTRQSVAVRLSADPDSDPDSSSDSARGRRGKENRNKWTERVGPS